MRKTAFCVLAFLLAGTVSAQDDSKKADEPKKAIGAIVPGPRPKAPEWTEIKCEPGVPISLTVEGAKDVQWIVWDDAEGTLTPVPGSTSAVFSAPKACRCRVLAVADGRVFLATLVAGTPPPGPPGPGPKPKPPAPAPVDELTKKLQAAYDADPGPDKAGELRQLIAIYQAAIGFAKDKDSENAAVTVDDLFGRVSTAAASLLPTPKDGPRKLDGLRKLIAIDLNTVIPTNGDQILTDADRAAAAAAFEKYAKALLGVNPAPVQ